MIRLPNTGTYSLELVTAQNGAQVVVCYADNTTNSWVGGIQTTTISTATTTTICSTPAVASTVRDIDEINIKNTFAGSHTITVQIDANAANIPVVTAALLTDESLNYTHGSGWQCKDANGNTKTTPLTAMTSAQLLALISDPTGSGASVFAISPVLVTPALGTPASGDLSNCTSNTEAAANNSTQIATTAYADRLTAGTLAGAFTTLSASGNVTLGDATTDTTTVNGYMGIGGAGNANYALNIVSSALTGVTQYGIRNAITISSGATAAGICFGNIISTQAAAFTVPSIFAIRAFDVSKGAGSSITNQYGLYIDDQTQGANNYGINLNVTSGANKWNILSGGTANSAFNGPVRFGGVTAPVATVDVTGSIAATTTIKTGGYTVATLPAGATGDRAYVTDATAPTYLGALTGGGAVVCPVFKNASAWVSA